MYTCSWFSCVYIYICVCVCVLSLLRLLLWYYTCMCIYIYIYDYCNYDVDIIYLSNMYVYIYIYVYISNCLYDYLCMYCQIDILIIYDIYTIECACCPCRTHKDKDPDASIRRSVSCCIIELLVIESTTSKRNQNQKVQVPVTSIEIVRKSNFTGNHSSLWCNDWYMRMVYDANKPN